MQNETPIHINNIVFYITCKVTKFTKIHNKQSQTPFKRLALLLAHWGIAIDRVNNPLLLKNSDTLSIISIDISTNLSENDGEKVYRIRESSMVQMFDLVKTHLLGGKDVHCQPQKMESAPVITHIPIAATHETSHATGTPLLSANDDTYADIGIRAGIG